MEIGTYLPMNPHTAGEMAKYAEAQGFSHGWFGDLPLSFADVYVSMAMAAKATSKIKLGTSIAVAPFRSPPVTVHSIATINSLAPGRTILGFGSGSFGRAMAGLPPIKMSEFRRQIETIRGLLREGEALYEIEGKRRKIRFFNRDWKSINLEDPIPLYIGASAPKAVALAGEFGDGLITGGPPIPEFFAWLLQLARAAAEKIGRQLPAKFPCVVESYLCVLHSGESLESSRVIETIGPLVITGFRMMAMGAIPIERLPPSTAAAYREWTEQIGLAKCSPDERHLTIWEGLFGLRPEERQFVTPEAIRSIGLVGTLDEVVDRIKALERSGVTQVSLGFADPEDIKAIAARV